MGRISYSQLSMFSECPQRWKLNYIDKVTESEPSIHLLFGTAMHEVIQTWLEVMYHDSVKNANKLNLEQRLHDKMMELFKQDKETYDKNPCILEELREFFQDGGYKICEVNSNPGFEGMENFTNKNIAGEIVTFIKLKLG